MTTGKQEGIVLQVRIAAKPETIFPYFTDPEKMMLWKGIEAELEPYPGGIYRVNVTGKDIAVGKYVEIVPPTRVVFTWGWEEEGHPVPPGTSTVEVTLTPDGDATLVRLRHYGFPSEETQNAHIEGWEHYMARLEIRAAGGDPGVDPWVGRP